MKAVRKRLADFFCHKPKAMLLGETKSRDIVAGRRQGDRETEAGRQEEGGRRKDNKSVQDLEVKTRKTRL